MADLGGSLVIRDGVFAQFFFLSLLALTFYRAWCAPYPQRRRLAQTAGFFLFLGLFIITVINLWQP